MDASDTLILYFTFEEPASLLSQIYNAKVLPADILDGCFLVFSGFSPTYAKVLDFCHASSCETESKLINGLM